MHFHHVLPWTPILVVLCIGSLFSGAAWAQSQIEGRVRASGDKGIANAHVRLVDGRQSVRSAISSSTGSFALTDVPNGKYVIEVDAPGFSTQRQPLDVNGSVTGMVIGLTLAPVREEVSVTADPGRVETTSELGQQVNVISPSQIQARAKSVTAQAFNEEEGVHWQRTSPTISGVFVRGLTGNKVNVFVDGVRYSHAAARGGINTFLNLVEASSLEGIEVLRGPNSAQYGSDALGGSIQFLTLTPDYGFDVPSLRQSLTTNFSSADLGYGSNYSASYGARRFGVVTNLDAHRSNTLYTGSGIDSHSAVTRFLGLPSDLFYGSRMPGTAFTQYGGLIKALWSPQDNHQFSAMYSRSQQDNGKRFDQLLGGDGNLIADLSNLKLDFAYLRYTAQRLGWIDGANLTYSYNAQREERINQGGQGSNTAAIGHEPERIRVHGIQGHLDKRVAKQDLLFGAEYSHERDRSRAFNVDPVTLAVTDRRPRVPHNALYQTGGVFLQDVYQVIPERLRLTGSVRYSAASYRARAADSPATSPNLWPDDSMRVSDWTFRAGIAGVPVKGLTVYFNASRGFRAPHVTDLGTLGITGAGFEVAAPDVAGLGATIGDSAAGTAVSTGRPVIQVQPETSITYEAGAHVRARNVSATFSVFVNDINDNITKQALILPPGAVGTAIGGQVITAQDPGGAVFVAAAASPVLVRANFDDARIWGFEHEGEWRITPQWTVGTVFTYLHAEDVRTGLAPNIEGGTPAPDGWLRLRYTAANQRWWMEPYMHAAARQDRLSSLDIEDRRTGATRTRGQIQNFFRRGATNRGFVSSGPNGTFGNADDILLVTGETLAQIQDRVLGVGVNSAPLYTAVPGYAVFGLRGGLRIGERHNLSADFENINDKNYRGISWGVDAPGRGISLSYRVTF
jgi:hemoglobin/transferrin/lactoferrin receptor protein